MGLAAERSQYLDIDGKPITEDYQGHLKYQIEQSLKESFGTLSGFLTCWDDAERKQAIIDKLAEHGIDLAVLQQAIPNGK